MVSEPLVDHLWVGYHPRAAVPLLVAAAIASGTLLVGRWYLDDLSIAVDRAGALTLYATVFALWPCLLALRIYRSITYTYRLTDRLLLIDRGPLTKREEPIDLAEIRHITTGTNWAGFGWVEITTSMNSVVKLLGVRHPEAFARAIRQASDLQRIAR